MFYQTFKLSEKYPDATLTAYVCDAEPKVSPRPCVIVCPGGGYGGLSPREGEPIVRKLLAAGFNAYLLMYSVGEAAKNYAPLIEAALAVKLVRERAEEDNTNPQKIYIMGFSAGGHLAAWASTMWNCDIVRDALGISAGKAPEGINRPDGMILCYPVITAGEFTHLHSVQRISGQEQLDEAAVAEFSIENHVDATTPKAFIWHTFTDRSVPVQNSLLMMNALCSAGIPFESHIFPEGCHGLSLCSAETEDGNPHMVVPHAECWIDLAIKWVRDF